MMATGGTCNTCGKDLVQVTSDEGEIQRTYHPFNSLGVETCPALLPIDPDDPTSPLSFDVPADQFVEVTDA